MVWLVVGMTAVIVVPVVAVVFSGLGVWDFFRKWPR